MNTTKCAVFAAALAVASPALAGSTAASDWAGFYVGGQLGASYTGTEGMIAPDGDEIYSEGSHLGLHAGYQHDLGFMLLGAEVDRQDIDIDQIPLSGAVIPLEDEWTMTRLKVRAGVDAGKFNPYVTAGLAKIETSDTNSDGAFAGVGLDYMVTDRFSVGGEFAGHKIENPYDPAADDLLTGSASVRASFNF